jgi:hypothetical protein
MPTSYSRPWLEPLGPVKKIRTKVNYTTKAVEIGNRVKGYITVAIV